MGEKERHRMRPAWPESKCSFLGGGDTHIVKSSEFVHQPVELEQVEVPVAEDGPFVDGGS